MSAPDSVETRRLSPIFVFIDERVRKTRRDLRDEAALQLLEAAASQIGGFDLPWYWEQVGAIPIDSCDASEWGAELADRIKMIGIPPALALAAAARPPLTVVDKRQSGAFYTDYRLAGFLASLAAKPASLPIVLDPACGSGALLVASAIRFAGSDDGRMDRFLEHNLYGVDLSPRAVRGASLALASLASSRTAIKGMIGHLRVGDSLSDGKQIWSDLGQNGFDLVIGNPPWEKLKLSRHEFLRAKGIERHYGHTCDEADAIPGLLEARSRQASYIDSLMMRFDHQGSGERDLYSLFTELAFDLVRPGGQVALLLPAGLIRSQGTYALRRFLLENGTSVEITLIENRARFFPIDTRMKFIALRAMIPRAGSPKSTHITVGQATATADCLKTEDTVRISQLELRRLRPDLTIPEVRCSDEWRIFRRMCQAGSRFGDPRGAWRPKFFREIDMTNDRDLFCESASSSTLPLVEGRMVHQFRFGAKRFVSGTGRAAKWDPVEVGREHVAPQFFCRSDGIADRIRDRARRRRIGFCDVTGQTNERTILAAEIPNGVICGNKVPTVSFLGYTEEDAQVIGRCWLAIANSIPFDWLARRVVTTSVNFFILESLPLPDAAASGTGRRRLADLAERAAQLYRGAGAKMKGHALLWQIAEVRARIDSEVAGLYGLDLDDLGVILGDFPLLDRGQPPLAGEEFSTVTRDYLMYSAYRSLGEASGAKKWLGRVNQARDVGAVPYVSAEYARRFGSSRHGGWSRSQGSQARCLPGIS